MDSFSEQCYQVLKNVPPGYITTYKELAKALNTKAYQAIGNAMKSNPYIPSVPCHRVVKSNGHIGGYVYGEEEKKKLLRKENIQVNAEGYVKNFNTVFYSLKL